MKELLKHHLAVIWIVIRGLILFPIVLLITIFVSFWMSFSLSFDGEFRFMRWLKDLRDRLNNI